MSEDNLTTQETLFEGEPILDFGDTSSPPIWVLAQIAEATHQANRSYCAITGDNSQPAWADAPNWQKVSAIKGVLGVYNGNTPEQSHESWLKEKAATGWKYGEVKDVEKKEHPCFVPYSELPPLQKVKDHVFVSTAKVLLDAYYKLPVAVGPLTVDVGDMPREKAEKKIKELMDTYRNKKVYDDTEQ